MRRKVARKKIAKKRAVKKVIVPRKRAYEGASNGKRLKYWKTPSTSINAENLTALSTLRNRSRDLVRNNGYAAKAIDELVGNTVGTGILPKITAQSKRAEAGLRRAWERWAESPECDADGLHDIYGLQALIARSMFEGGEVLLRRRWRRSSDGLTVPLQIQILEADYIDTSKNEELKDGGVIVQGVEFDVLGRRRAYWLYRRHPGDSFFRTGSSVRVSAEDIVPIFEVCRPGQVRGIPRAAPVIVKLRDFDESQDAALVTQKIASCFTAFITKPIDAEGAEDDENLLPEKLEPGLLWELEPGQQVQFGSPPPLSGYADFSKITLHSIAAGMRIPYEVLSGDYKGMNWSSGRLSWIGFHRGIEMLRWITFIPRACRIPFQWFLEAAALAGIETQGATSVWTPPRREMVDPIKEIQALRDAVRSGFMSLSEAIRQLGYDPEDVLEEMAGDMEVLDKLGLTLDSDPRRVTKSGMSQPEANTSESDEGEDGENEENGDDE